MPFMREQRGPTRLECYSCNIPKIMPGFIQEARLARREEIMRAYAIWEKDAFGGWRAAMTFESRAEAEAALKEWALEFMEEYGDAPGQGRDFRLTRDLHARLDIWEELENLRRNQASLPENSPVQEPTSARKAAPCDA